MKKILQSVYRYLQSLKSDDESRGRHIVPGLLVEACASIRAPKILDVGAGFGDDLFQAKKIMESTPEFYAIETLPAAVSHLRKMGFSVASIDIERDRLPFSSEYFDAVLCNQVLEHTKEIFWVISEFARVTKIGGRIILGVPNLGSLHNRLALLFG